MRCFGLAVPHPRCYVNYYRVIGRYVRELRLISNKDTTRKMTSLPAQTFNLHDRSILREGFAANLIIFYEATINDRATFDQPHQYPTGISHVIVNGQTVFANGQMTAARPGAALRGRGSLSAL